MEEYHDKDPIKWRPHLRQLVNRSIYMKDLPKLFSAMNETGLIPILEAEGLRWYCGRYHIKNTEVARVWNLSRRQMDRINNHIIEEGWPYWES